MYCSECGKELPDDSLFCTECGTNLSQNSGSTLQKEGNIGVLKWLAISVLTALAASDCGIQLLLIVVREDKSILIINGIICFLLFALLFLITFRHKKIFFTVLGISIVFAGLLSAMASLFIVRIESYRELSSEVLNMVYSFGLIVSLIGMLVLSFIESIIIATNNISLRKDKGAAK